MTTLTRALPLLTPRWLRLWTRFAALHWRHVAARELGSRVGTDPRVRERGGRVGTTLWLVTAYGPSGPPWNPAQRWRVRWMDLRRPGEASERWTGTEEGAWAWVALASIEHHWALMAGEHPLHVFQALRGIEPDEVRAALRAAGCEAETLERVAERQAPRRRA